MTYSTTPPLIHLSHVRKSYFLGDKTEIEVLKGIDLHINHGEFVALMGYSGSGKSTLLNILGLLHPLGDGIYEFEGENISTYKDDYSASYIRNRKIGFIFQSYFLIPRLSALQNVMLPSLYAQSEPDYRKEKAIEYLHKVGLGDKIHHKPSELSGGQQQRVAIARALINEPDLILADEPTGALDQITSKEIMELIKTLHQSGKTIVMVTHDKEIAAYATRIIYLKDGIVADHNYLI